MKHSLQCGQCGAAIAYEDEGEPLTTERINSILELGNKHGVKRLDVTNMGLVIEYTPRGKPLPLEKLSAILPKPLPFIDPEAGMCACGHGYLEHNSTGECLRGCAIETCAKGEVS